MLKDKKYRIGIDLGGTNIKVGIVNAENEIIGRHSIQTNVNRPYTDIIADMAYAVTYALESEGISEAECEKIGIGSPGTIECSSGVVVYSNNFGWKDIPLREELSRYFKLPIYISNDANCAALGEVVAGAAKGCKNAVLLTLGTGVGSGIILDGKVFEGGHAGGAEFGHSVLVVDGEPCTCTRKGCFEAYASATALIRDTKRAALNDENSQIHKICENNLDNINGLTPFTAAKENDPAAKKVVENYIQYLSEGIAYLINLFRPDKVLLSGGVCNQGEVLTIPVNEQVKKLCFGGEEVYIADVERASLGNDAGIIGAAALSN